MKYIVVTGGIISGLGKGITSSSIALLFQSMGYVVTMIKIDPYLNVDSGLISPYEHGECFVLSDGGECDLDLGNYERALNINLTRHHNITTGRIYAEVIRKERKGEYCGSTVQVVPHITNEIIKQINETSHLLINDSVPEVCIIEVGGTIGDIEGLPFIEALQQMKSCCEDSFCFVHVVMTINNPEPKTKPIQHSVSALRSRGIFPDILIVRSTEILHEDIRLKLNRFCQINKLDIISNPNANSIYEVPSNLNKQGICLRIAQRINLPVLEVDNPYIKFINYKNQSKLVEIEIGIAGKYINNIGSKSPDTYLSLCHAIEHAACYLNVKVNLHWIDCEVLEEVEDNLYDAFIIPGGFGSRGLKGKTMVAEYARKNKIPILGICLGMQIMVINYYNTHCGTGAISREWSELGDENSKYLVDILPNQNEIMGATMRLGNYQTCLLPSQVKDLYGKEQIIERHRHRYEVNNKYIEELEKVGMNFVGYSDLINGDQVVEVLELSNHPFYVGCQYHPEYRSRCSTAHPLFVGLLKSSLNNCK